MRIKKYLWLILVLLGTLVFSTFATWAADGPAKIRA